MGVVTSDRQFHGLLFQRKMEQWEIEREITMLEKKFRKMDKYGDISGWFDIQDELGLMYNRLMKIQETKNKAITKKLVINYVKPPLPPA